MRKAMEKWLNQRQITFDPNTANSICDKFGLDGEKADECLGLCYQLESDKITQAEFTGGLCVITGKEPEEVMGILRDVKPVSDRKVVAVIGNKGEMVKGLTKAIADKELATACYNALANHGIAVHYTILGKMVRRYYKPEITDQQVLSCLGRHKDLFRKIEGYPGSYFLAGKKEGQTYPEMEAMGILKGVGSSNIKDYIECRKCGACCEAISISSPIPGMPGGKPAGVRCIHLTKENLCNLFGKPERPKICSSFPAMMDICGATREEALQLINALEIATSIGGINGQKKDW